MTGKSILKDHNLILGLKGLHLLNNWKYLLKLIVLDHGNMKMCGLQYTIIIIIIIQ